MKRFSEQLHTKALTVKLKAAERAELRERVVSYMEYHPLPESAKRTLAPSERALFTEPYRTISFGGWQVARYLGVAVCVLAVTISYSAENAVPGDSLYAVKVRFNEEVRASLALSPYEKITWETERLNRRIAEAHVLASEGKLTGEVEEGVANAVREHGEKARREIAVLKETDSDEAALATLHLATTLDVQSAALRGGTEEVGAMSMMMSKSAADTAPASPLASVTAQIASALEEERTQTEVSTDTVLPGYERLLAHAEADTTRARELLSTIADAATAEEAKDIKRRLDDVDRTLALALEQAGGNKDDARPLLVDVLKRTQRLIVFMTNIDVREALTVETLVPVVLTNEERAVGTRDLLASSATNVARIETALMVTTVDAEVGEKIADALVRIAELQTEADIAIGAGDMEAAEVKAGEAHALSLDTITLLGLDETAPVPEVPVETGTTSTTSTSTVLEGEVEGVSSTTTTTTAATTTNNRGTSTERGLIQKVRQAVDLGV